MTGIYAGISESLRTPLSPARRDDHPLATADSTDPCREVNATILEVKVPTEEVKAAALRAPARVKRATGAPTDVLRALENRHRWLLFAQHCYTCSRCEEECELGKLCTYGKKTLKHVAQCKKDECSYPRCKLLKPLLQHSRRCQSSTCAICVPVWNYIQKDTQQQPQQQQQQQPDPQQPQHLLAAPQSQTSQQHAEVRADLPPPARGDGQGPTRRNAGPAASTATTATAVTIASLVREPPGGRSWSPPALRATAAASVTTSAAAASGGTAFAAAAAALPNRPEPAASRVTDKVEGGASTCGGGEGHAVHCAAAAASPSLAAAAAAGAETDGRLSTTGACGSGGGGLGPTGRPEGPAGLGGLVLMDRSELRLPLAADGLQQGVQRQQQLSPVLGAAAGAGIGGPVGGGGGASVSGPSSLGLHRFIGITAGGAGGGLPLYALPPYGGAAAASAGGSGGASVQLLDSAERPASGGVTITATPPQPIPVANGRSAVHKPPAVPGAGQPPLPLVHSYPPSSSLGAFFPQFVAAHHHHASTPHPSPSYHQPSPGPPSTAAVAAHWLPLQGLAGLSGGIQVGGASPNLTGGGGGGGGGANFLLGATTASGAMQGGGGGASQPVVWANAGAAALPRPGTLALYGIPADAVRPNGPSAAGGAPAATATADALQGADRHSAHHHHHHHHHPYALTGVNGTNGIAAAAPLLLWPAGHGPPVTSAAGAAPQGHLPTTHLAAPQYTVGASIATVAAGATGAPRISGGAAGLPVGLSPGSAGAAAQPAVLYGHPQLAPAPAAGGNAGGGGGGAGGGPSGATPGGLGAMMTSGGGLWSFVLR